jgi:tyrosine-protein phosphatase SIW14
MKHWHKHWRVGLSLFLACASVASIVWYAWHQERAYRNLRAVQPGVLYRSGQLTKKGLLRVMHELNIGTVINLRAGDSDQRINTTSWEAELCDRNFVTFVPIALGSPDNPDQITPEASRRAIDTAVEQFLEVIDNPEAYPRPILIHCLAGMHRTGVLCALFRMEAQGWSKEQALAEMKELGYRDFSGPDPLRDFVVRWTPTHARTTISSSPAPGTRLLIPVSRIP